MRADGVSIEEEGGLPPPGRCQVPGDWGETLGASFRGRVLFERGFGHPTELVAGDRVELVIGRVDAWARVVLNEVELATIDAGHVDARFEIAGYLRNRNELRIEVELPRLTAQSPPLPRPGREDLAGGIVGEVRLEIYVGENA